MATLASSADGRLVPDVCINGNYELLRELGSGGMARVWLARQVRTHDRVALKFPSANAEGGIDLAMAAARLEQEYRLLGSLAHDQLVRVRELDRWQGKPFFVMDFIDGETLGQWLATRHNALSLKEVTDLLRPIASVLDYLHQKSIVHRDLSPQNVLVSGNGRQIMLIDLGIAVGDELTLTQAIDRPSFLGKPRYSAPEQVNGFSVVDARADLYSMAAISLEVLSRQKFSRAEIECQLERAALPPALGAAIRRALSKSPEERPATVGEFFEAFEQSVQSEAQLPRPRARGLVLRGSHLVVLSFAVACGGGALWAGVRLLTPDASSQVAEPIAPTARPDPPKRESAAPMTPDSEIAAPQQADPAPVTPKPPDAPGPSTAGQKAAERDAPAAPRVPTKSPSKATDPAEARVAPKGDGRPPSEAMTPPPPVMPAYRELGGL